MINGKKTALLSVYDKTGITDFAQRLRKLGWDILASGGTAKHLKAAGVEVIDIATMVGPPILGHRVVTLSREIHAGLLAQNTPEDKAELGRLGIRWIGLVYVNLYPLKKETKKTMIDLGSVLEMMDIGGPTLLSAASKGQRIVLTDSQDAQDILAHLESGQNVEPDLREHLAAKADYVVSQYRALTANFRGEDEFLTMHGELAQECPYGENPYQKPAGLYACDDEDPLAIHRFVLVGGNPPGYNILCYVDRALQTMTHISAGLEENGFEVPCLAIALKHGNACGAAMANGPLLALEKMVEGDPLAITGGLVMVNFSVSKTEAEVLLQHISPNQKRLIDAVVAPDFSDEAIEILARKHGKCRLLQNSKLAGLDRHSLDQSPIIRPVRGAALRQPNYTYVPDFDGKDIVCHGTARSGAVIVDLILAQAIGRTSNSNTITIVKDGQLIGNGVGQQDRFGAAELAVSRARRAGHTPKLTDSVACGDSFFPFEDGVRVLVEAGVRTIFATSGSINDAKVIEYCKGGISLYLVPDVIGRGFFRE